MLSRLINTVLFAAALIFAWLALDAGQAGHSGGARALDGFIGLTSGLQFDARSLLMGLSVGIIIGQLAGVRWYRLLRVTQLWLARRHETLMRMALGLLCLGLLIYW